MTLYLSHKTLKTSKLAEDCFIASRARCELTYTNAGAVFFVDLVEFHKNPLNWNPDFIPVKYALIKKPC